MAVVSFINDNKGKVFSVLNNASVCSIYFALFTILLLKKKVLNVF